MRARRIVGAGAAGLGALGALVALGAAPAAAGAGAAPRSCALQWVPPSPRSAEAAAAPVSNVLFLNDCRTADCALTPAPSGGNDSRRNLSSVAQQPVTLEPWRFTDAEWDALVTCVRHVYAPFHVEIVTAEPPATTEYFEAMVAGRGGQLGFPAGIVGVAPFTCGVIPNAIAFAFANDYGNQNAGNAADLCWTVTHELAHVFGLQHKYDARDPMTYLQPPLPQKLFVDEDGPCGTSSARDCAKDTLGETGCKDGPSTTNSYRQIAAVFGADPSTPPTLTVASPLPDSEQLRGFAIEATAEDDVRVRDVALTLDGAAYGQRLHTPPYRWQAPERLAFGPHALELVATDYYGASTRVPLAVTAIPACSGAATGCGGGELCLDGRCIAGPSQPGGLGASCAEHEDCTSGVCAAAGAAHHCVEACVVGESRCPAGFRCLDSVAGGVCWPDEGDGGGCAAGEGGSGGLPIAGGLAFAAFVLVPRRRRR